MVLYSRASSTHHNLSPLGGGWWSPAVRAFGGGSPVREVGTSSCWAPPPSRQPQCGSAAPYHGKLGAIPRWGDKVRVEGPANGDGSSGYLHSPADSSHHCDAQGAQGVKGLCPELAWPPQVRYDCVYMWERTVMGISVHAAETEMATTPYEQY